MFARVSTCLRMSYDVPSEEATLVCSNCGYENPRGHRYCGMCGTPFPHRSMTVPSAQSTLSFTSAPLEISPSRKSGRAKAESPEPVPAKQSATRVTRVDPKAISPKLAGTEAPESERITASPERQKNPESLVNDVHPALSNHAVVSPSSPIEPIGLEDVAHPDKAEVPLTTPLRVEPLSIPEQLTDAGVGFAHAEATATLEAAVEIEPLRLTEADVPAKSKEPPAPVDHPDRSPSPPVREPEAPATPPVEEPRPSPEPLPSQPQLEAPVIPDSEREPSQEPEIPGETRIERKKVVPESRPPAPPLALPVRAPRTQHVTVTPQRPLATTTLTASQAKPTVVHRSPDSLPITPPPASAGMPTFQEVVDAAGAPPLSPFEQLAQTPANEEEELKQFVANFRYTPPQETADELTMRSEVPVVDKEAPAEFHHPSFDGDVPPPEEQPHPTGQEYYPPPGETPRSRFLDIDETAHQAKKHRAAKTGSLLGLDAESTVPTDEAARTSRRYYWLWSFVAVLVAIFAALGFLEGRAQSSNAFLGPVEWVQVEYGIWRDKLKETLAAPKAPEIPQRETAKQNTPETKPEIPADEEAARQPDTAAQPNASSRPNPTAPGNDSGQTTQEASPQPQSPPAENTEPGTTTANNVPATTAPAKPLEPPPSVRSSKPQPGQQELNKALDASDATAAAAWLWKATSRGNPEAPVRLADMYIKGNGVPRSCEQALVLLRSAAMKENAPARNRLAALYANGTCVARDKVKAYQLMSSALQADPNSEWAKEHRQELWNQMTTSERAMAQKYR